MATILISGGTGMIGTRLSALLSEKGHVVGILSRSKHEKTNGLVKFFHWDPAKKVIEKEAIMTADHIIHLAGENIFDKRWTKKRKQLIVDSRVKTSYLLFDKLMEYKHKPKTFVSASAIGYYGVRTSDKIFEETESPYNDFLGQTCRKWENAADRFKELGIRTVKIRTAPVLSKKGGALQKMKLPIKLGIGSAIGDGKQYMPWVHIEDLCGIYIKAIEDTAMNGAYNATAPDHKTNEEFMRTLAKAMKKPFWFPKIPKIILRILFGKIADAMVTGSRISSEKIRKAGYEFKFPDLETALKDLTIEK